MANSYLYNASIAQTVEDNKTYAQKRIYKIKECVNTLAPNNKEDLWNCNLCGQDDAYCQPYVKGDKIYQQFITDNETGAVFVTLHDGKTDALITSTGIVTEEIGQDENLTTYHNLIIDTTDLTNICWYVKVTKFNCTPDPAIFETCVESKMSGREAMTQEEAEFACYAELCLPEQTEEIFTEPYCEETCKNTLQLEGIYPGYDCNGNYYGDFISGTNSFKLLFRVYGEVNKGKYITQKTLINKENQTSSQSQTYNFTTEKIPPYVADQIALVFNSKSILIDGLEYFEPGELAKNNDFGQMWIINTTLTTSCSEIDFTCET